MRDRSEMRRISEQEYLSAEEGSSVRHEYVDGYVFAMSGATEAHNVICGNVFSFLHAHLLGAPCRAFMNDMKVRIEEAQTFYYPDIMITCEPYDAKSVSKSNPVVLIEVLSPSTAQIDRREKLIAYQKIASLKEYVILHQDRQRFDLYRRTPDGVWESFVFAPGQNLVLESLPGGHVLLPMSTIYQGCDPPGRVKECADSYSAEVTEV